MRSSYWHVETIEFQTTEAYLNLDLIKLKYSIYNAFHKFGRRWFTWGSIILKECVYTSGNKVISDYRGVATTFYPTLLQTLQGRKYVGYGANKA
jgi:hypothetical protein